MVFDDQASRSGVHARDFLRDWRGHLMVERSDRYHDDDAG